MTKRMCLTLKGNVFYSSTDCLKGADDSNKRFLFPHNLLIKDLLYGVKIQGRHFVIFQRAKRVTLQSTSAYVQEQFKSNEITRVLC